MRKCCLGVLIIPLVLLASCAKRPVAVDAELLVVEGAGSDAAAQMEQLLAPYRSCLAQEMGKEIGRATQTLEVGRPESLLSNYVCDVMLREANKTMATDFALTNVGGLRKSLSAGVVTLGDVYEVMPFDNRLVVLELKGSDVLALCDAIAAVGGEGVAGISFAIADRRVVDVKVGGKAVDCSKVYRVVTNDYLAFGNDKMTPLLNRQSITDLGMQLRDMLMHSIEEQGEISSMLDGRIYEK